MNGDNNKDNGVHPLEKYVTLGGALYPELNREYQQEFFSKGMSGAFANIPGISGMNWKKLSLGDKSEHDKLSNALLNYQLKVQTTQEYLSKAPSSKGEAFFLENPDVLPIAGSLFALAKFGGKSTAITKLGGKAIKTLKPLFKWTFDRPEKAKKIAKTISKVAPKIEETVSETVVPNAKPTILDKGVGKVKKVLKSGIEGAKKISEKGAKIIEEESKPKGRIPLYTRKLRRLTAAGANLYAGKNLYDIEVKIQNIKDNANRQNRKLTEEENVAINNLYWSGASQGILMLSTVPFLPKKDIGNVTQKLVQTKDWIKGLRNKQIPQAKTPKLKKNPNRIIKKKLKPILSQPIQKKNIVPTTSVVDLNLIRQNLPTKIKYEQPTITPIYRPIGGPRMYQQGGKYKLKSKK